jgi:chemotaxis signal transduction protein
MDQQEILSQILEQAGSGPQEPASHEDSCKFVFFRIGAGLYGLPADHVQEIMLDLQIHYLPFLPPYVRGLVNRLGEPVTVVDLECLFHHRRLAGRAFLILKPHISKMAFLIDEVQDILSVPVAEVGKLSATLEGLDGFVQGMLRYRGKDVLVLDDGAVIETVKEATRA